MADTQTHKHPKFTDIQCESCDGLGFVFKGELWKPIPCECMEDAPEVVEPYQKD